MKTGDHLASLDNIWVWRRSHCMHYGVRWSPGLYSNVCIMEKWDLLASNDNTLSMEEISWPLFIMYEVWGQEISWPLLRRQCSTGQLMTACGELPPVSGCFTLLIFCLDIKYIRLLHVVLGRAEGWGLVRHSNNHVGRCWRSSPCQHSQSALTPANSFLMFTLENYCWTRAISFPQVI